MHTNIISQDIVTGGVEGNEVAESVEGISAVEGNEIAESVKGGGVDSNNENCEFEAKSDTNGSSVKNNPNINNKKQKAYLKLKSRYNRLKYNAIVAYLMFLYITGEYLINIITGENAESEIRYISFVSGIPINAIKNSIEIAKKIDSSERFQQLLNNKSVSYRVLIKSLKFEVQDIELIFQTSRTKYEALKKYNVLNSVCFPNTKNSISDEPIKVKQKGERKKKAA